MAERSPKVRSRLLPWWLGAAVLLAGLLATAYYWHSAREQERAAFSDRFHSDAERVVANMARQLESFSVVMRGIQGLFQASEYISHDEFEQYARALEATEELAGVQAVAFAVSIPASVLNEHEARMREELGRPYRVHPAPVRERVAPIVYIHPLEPGNRQAVGFDVFSNPLAREAAERARDRDELVITAPLTLVQDRGREQVRSFVMYLPVYETAVSTAGVAERRRGIESPRDFRRLSCLSQAAMADSSFWR